MGKYITLVFGCMVILAVLLLSGCGGSSGHSTHVVYNHGYYGGYSPYYGSSRTYVYYRDRPSHRPPGNRPPSVRPPGNRPPSMGRPVNLPARSRPASRPSRGGGGRRR
jgi:hypothetical protein